MSHGALRTPQRGFLANPFTIPPLVYPFQYNPAQLTDTKRVEWTVRTPRLEQRGVGGLASGIGGVVSAAAGGIGAALGAAGGLTEYAGRSFSAAQLKKVGGEGDRTVSFQFHVDGREHRPGEPPRRRNPDGDILADLALMRSFVYPQAADWGDLVAAFTSGASLTHQLFNEPPTALLVLGGMSMEGYVSDLRIVETQFNARLDPVRADVDITLIEKIDSLSFVADSLERIGRAAIYTSYGDLPRVLV